MEKRTWRKFNHEGSNWRCSKQCCLIKITISYWSLLKIKVQKLWMSLQWKILNVGCILNFLILHGDCGLVMAGSWVFMSCSGDDAKNNNKISYFWYRKKVFVSNQQQTHCNINVGFFLAHSQPITGTEMFFLTTLYLNAPCRKHCSIDSMWWLTCAGLSSTAWSWDADFDPTCMVLFLLLRQRWDFSG